MQVWSSLPEEIGDLSGTASSSSSMALCRAILEDAQTDMEPHGAIEMLRAVTLGPCNLASTRAPLPRELTSLIF